MANVALYGFRNLKDQFAERISAINADVITTAIAESVAEHNRQMDALIAMFCQRTTRTQVRYKQLGAARLQPLDENGRALPIKPSGYYDVAFPVRSAGSAWGADFVTREKMTVEDANRVTALMTNADKIWLRDQILAGLYADTDYTFTDPQDGDVTVKPLANGDAVTYARNGSTTSSTDTHQLAQAAAISDSADPFSAIYDELVEHPENKGDVVALIPTNIKSAVTDLTGFKWLPDTNLAQGANDTTVTGSLGIATPGEILGYHTDKVWVVEWKALPDNYMIATTTNAEKPLAMREHEETSLQGFIQAPEQRNDHPFYETQWMRFAGFGGWSRIGALAYRVGNATYGNAPTGYAPPIW